MKSNSSTVKELKKKVMKVFKIEKKKYPSVKYINTLKQRKYIIIYITDLLNKLDEKAVGTRTPQFICEKYTDVTIQKSESIYIVRSNWITFSTINRKEIEDFLYKLII